MTSPARALSRIGGPEHAEWHVFGAAVHGALAALHALGLLYNARRRNLVDLTIHAVVCAYDLGSVVAHLRAVRRGACP